MIACTKCKASLVLNRSALTKCPSCGVVMQVDVFPALFREQTPGPSGETLLVDDEASCFYHPKKRAVIPCAICGRFLCALCDVELNNRHLCPACLDAGKRKRKIKSLENHRTLYDSIALFLAIVPMLFVWPVIVTAPMVPYVVVRYWKAPTSIIPRTKVRFIIALILAGLQIVGLSLFIYSLVTR